MTRKITVVSETRPDHVQRTVYAVYVDDIFIHSCTDPQEATELRDALERLSALPADRRAGLMRALEALREDPGTGPYLKGLMERKG